jgi:hypothetical protein
MMRLMSATGRNPSRSPTPLAVGLPPAAAAMRSPAAPPPAIEALE